MTKTTKKGLTDAQKSMFWTVFGRACAVQGILDGQGKADYRHRLLEEETGKRSLTEINRTTDFDRVMYRIAVDAEDFDKAASFAVCDERRMGYLIKVCCLQLMQLKGGDEAEARRYLGGILDQARIPNGVSSDDNGYWMDLALGQAAKVFQMLDTHRRRLLKGRVSRSPFRPTVRYELNGPILTIESVPAEYYSRARFSILWQKEGK